MNIIDRWFEYRLELKRIENESKVCQSCESLKLELARLHSLIDNLTAPKQEIKIEPVKEIPQPIRPPHRSWKVKQQELEANDRANARLIQEKVQEELRLRKPPIPEIVLIEKEPITAQTAEEEILNVESSISEAS